jgi:hypothetical protein
MIPVALATMAGGQIYSGMQANAQGKSAQNMAEYNAAMQEREAKQVERKTAMEQRLQAESADRAMSTTRAGLGMSGAVSTEGSPLLIQAKQASESELENLMIGYEGREQATSLREGAALSRMEGKIARKKGKSSMYSSFIGAGSSLLTGFGTAYSGANTSYTGTQGFNTSNNFGRSASSLNFGY